jgi:hypothetical protein
VIETWQVGDWLKGPVSVGVVTDVKLHVAEVWLDDGRVVWVARNRTDVVKIPAPAFETGTRACVVGAPAGVHYYDAVADHIDKRVYDDTRDGWVYWLGDLCSWLREANLGYAQECITIRQAFADRMKAARAKTQQASVDAAGAGAPIAVGDTVRHVRKNEQGIVQSVWDDCINVICRSDRQQWVRRNVALVQRAVPAAAPAPTLSSDAALVGKMQSIIGLNDDPSFVASSPRWASRPEHERAAMQAAWSAEVRHKVAAADAERARRERERVVCESQYDLLDGGDL